MKVIESMVFVTRVKDEVILHGITNEAIEESCIWFHQWKFANLNGRFVIHNHNTKKLIDIEKELSKKYTVLSKVLRQFRKFWHCETRLFTGKLYEAKINMT